MFQKAIELLEKQFAMQTVKPAVKDTPVSTAAAQDAQQPNVTAGMICTSL